MGKHDMITPTTKPTRRLRRTRQPRELGFTDFAPRDAAPRLGFATVDALWAYLRRHEAEPGHVDLGGGAYAYRRGKRTWIVRIPVA